MGPGFRRGDCAWPSATLPKNRGFDTVD